MLSEQQLVHLLARHEVPLAGRQMIQTIRTSDPSRRTGGGTHNVAVRFASRKMGCVIQAESHKNELPAIYCWEHDAQTQEFYDQPPQIKLSYRTAGGRNVTHLSTPDFFLLQDDWIGWVENKTEEFLLAAQASGSERFQPDGNGGWRCPAGEVFAAQYGLGFKVRSSKENNWILIRNLEFLSDYYAPSCVSIGGDEMRAIVAAFGSDRWMTLRDLLQQDGLNSDRVNKAIADGIIFVDLSKELMSEPNYTTVCRDAESAEIYRGQKSAQVAFPSAELRTIKIEPQTDVSWDGQPWRIINVGVNDIFLINAENDIVNLAKEKFHVLVAKGAIVGDVVRDDKEVLAEKLIKQAAESDLRLAATRLNIVDAVEHGGKCDVIPARTLRYLKAQAAQGVAAVGNRFVGLLPRISHRGNRNRKLPEEAIAIMNQVIDGQVLVESKPNVFACYGTVVNLASERGIVCPSEKTFRGEIAKRRLDLCILAREGRKAAYRESEYYWRVDQSTPRHGERPFELGHIDHTELDIELVDEETGENLGRPWLTIMIDAFTRVVLAFYITFDPPSYRSCMCVIRECVRRYGRISKKIIVDLGRDFQGTYFDALTARLECHKLSRPAAKSRFGSLVERFFGITNQALIHNLIGNSQALQKPRSMSSSHDPRKLAGWTLAALTELFGQFADDHYGNWRHTTLGISPNEAMARGLATAGERAHLLIPFDDAFRFLCLPSTKKGTVRVHAGRGICVNRIDYWHPAFRDLGGITSLPVRFDPFDVSHAYVLLRGQWLECVSQYRSLLERRSEREMAIISQEIRARFAQKSIHRKVRASDIATLLKGAHESEAVLRQRRRDAGRPEITSAEAFSETSSSGICAEMADSPWGDQDDLDIFGELK